MNASTLRAQRLAFGPSRQTNAAICTRGSAVRTKAYLEVSAATAVTQQALAYSEYAVELCHKYLHLICSDV